MAEKWPPSCIEETSKPNENPPVNKQDQLSFGKQKSPKVFKTTPKGIVKLLKISSQYPL